VNVLILAICAPHLPYVPQALHRVLCFNWLSDSQILSVRELHLSFADLDYVYLEHRSLCFLLHVTPPFASTLNLHPLPDLVAIAHFRTWENRGADESVSAEKPVPT